MSNALAVAAVTSTLRYVLELALGGDQPGPVGGAKVTTLRPADVPPTDSADGAPTKCINVFLYQVTPNHAGNLTDLPTRRPDGSLAHAPIAALDLHYLLTFHGDDADLDAQRLLGRAVLALTVTSVLTRDVIALAMQEYAQDTGTEFLGDADLADQIELVKLAPATLSTEEIARLWAALGTGYRLGLTYTATVVMLEAVVPARTALPVRRRAVSVEPIGRPRVDAVEPAVGAVVVGATLDIRGSGLRGPGAAVRIGAAELAPAGTVLPDRMAVVVSDAVAAGVHTLQVTHRKPAGPGGVPPSRIVARSNSVPVLVRPTVEVGAVTADVVTLAVTPPLYPRQRASVTLSRLDDAPDAVPVVTFALQPHQPGTPPAGVVDLDRHAIPDGSWLIRISVDGAESLPVLHGETYSAPALVLP